jgi:hypothetical protein
LYDALQSVCEAGRALWRAFEQLKEGHTRASTLLETQGELKTSQAGRGSKRRSIVMEFLNDPSKASDVELELGIDFPAGFRLRESVEDYARCRSKWREFVTAALLALDSHNVVLLMDGSASGPAHERWTTAVRRELESLRDRMPKNPYVTNVGIGDDGLALWNGLKTLESRCTELSAVSPAVPVEAVAPTYDDDVYQPAAWFGGDMPGRLRKAASKDRKGKRVRKRTIDGVVVYSVADARRWWPNDVPK